MLYLFYLLPTALLSRFFGILSRIAYPKAIQLPILRLYSLCYGVNLEESEEELSAYHSLNHFFTRRLKSNARPMPKNSKKALLAPVDGLLSIAGPIRNNTLIQAKGRKYSLGELLFRSDYEHSFSGGEYALFYLSPRDCHRIYAPCDMKILGYLYVPGRLLPVNTKAVTIFPKLFVRNERLITFFMSGKAIMAIVKIGAVNVGSINLNYDSSVQTNTWQRKTRSHRYEKAIKIAQGEEMAYFAMGSTLILLGAKGAFRFTRDLRAPQAVQFRQKIGEL